jgi:hypothetical protein
MLSVVSLAKSFFAESFFAESSARHGRLLCRPSTPYHSARKKDVKVSTEAGLDAERARQKMSRTKRASVGQHMDNKGALFCPDR